MEDYGCFNFYTQFEYEPYQQYQQHPSEDERITNIENTLNMFMQDTTQRFKNISLQLELMQAQTDFILTVLNIQNNNQSFHEEQDFSEEIVKEGVDGIEEDTTLEECGNLEIETPHKEKLPQERSDTEEAETVENDEEMKVEWLLIKEESMEERGKKLSKVEIDRVIDEICVLFDKPKLGRIWTPHQLYLKFMEFLPKRRNTKDDVLSVSFWPP
jgi:hypothetical protein